MKSLITVLKNLTEARQLVGELPFSLEEFEELVDIVRSDFYDARQGAYDEYNDLQELIENRYGEGAWAGLVYSIAYGRWRTKEPDEIYDIISKLPINRVKHILGAGSEGSVIEISGNKVLKVFHGGITPRDEKFMKYCMTHKVSQLPKIYKMSNIYVVMDKYELESDACEEFIDMYWDNHDAVQQLENAIKSRNNKVALELIDGTTDDELKEHLKWWYGFYTGMMEAIGTCYSDEVGLNNIGETKDGDIVFFDPLGM